MCSTHIFRSPSHMAISRSYPRHFFTFHESSLATTVVGVSRDTPGMYGQTLKKDRWKRCKKRWKKDTKKDAKKDVFLSLTPKSSLSSDKVMAAQKQIGVIEWNNSGLLLWWDKHIRVVVPFKKFLTSSLSICLKLSQVYFK